MGTRVIQTGYGQQQSATTKVWFQEPQGQATMYESHTVSWLYQGKRNTKVVGLCCPSDRW